MPKDQQERINQALTNIENGMSVRDAADRCGCTATTLYIHIKKKNIVKPKVPLDTLSESDEERLGKWFVYCHYMGYFQKAVTNLQKEACYLGRTYVSKRRFDQEWSKQFPQTMPNVKTSVEVYDNYNRTSTFDNKCLGALLIYCRSRDLLHCFEDPRYLYYLMQLDIGDHMKLILAFSADGRITSPLIINSNYSKQKQFEDLILPLSWIKYNWQEANSKNNEIPLIYYVEEVLKTHLFLENIDKPILLFHKYIFQPISLEFYEKCVKYKVYPVNTQMQRSAFTFHRSLQMETAFRMGSGQMAEMSCCVDLIKEIIEVKLTPERMSESFSEYGIFPLAVEQSVIDKLPRLKIRSIADSTAQKLPTLNATTYDIQSLDERLHKGSQHENIKSSTKQRTFTKAAENDPESQKIPNSNLVVQKRPLNKPSKAISSKVMRMVIPPAKRKAPSSVSSATNRDMAIN